MPPSAGFSPVSDTVVCIFVPCGWKPCQRAGRPRDGPAGLEVLNNEGKLWKRFNFAKTQHAAGRRSGAVVGDLNVLAQKSEADLAPDFGRLSCPG